MDQRTCIKFCVKNKINCADAFRMLTVAYGEATLDRSNVYRWYKMFSEGREDVNDEERAGRPSTSTTDEKINEVEKMILANRRNTVREVSEDLNISIGSCHSIFINDLGIRRVAAKFVPKLLNCDQNPHRMNIANEMLDSVRDDPNLLQRVITDDEAWVYGYDVETKVQSSQWKLLHEPRPKKARQVRSNVKVLLTVFFDCRGVVHHEFLPQGRKVNKEYYLQVMRNLREAIRQKRPDLWKNKNWLLHHDNGPAHTSLLVRDFLAKNNTLTATRPMKGRRYATLDEIKTASKEKLKKILKNDFLKCLEDWKNRWHKCIISHGDYFEGDKIASHVMFCQRVQMMSCESPGFYHDPPIRAYPRDDVTHLERPINSRDFSMLPEFDHVLVLLGRVFVVSLSRLKFSDQNPMDYLRPDRQGQIILLHDNARPHVAQVVKAALQEFEWEVLQHPPYSPDLAPTDYHLFRSMSNHMRGTTFDEEEDLKTWLNNFFDTRPDDFWRNGINKLVERWEEVGNAMEECEQREGESHTHDEILKVIKTRELYTLSYFSGGHGKGKLGMGFLRYRCRVREMRLRLEIA
ncbi:hypothetical protein LAZ67_4002984 [Cordylochernes scorpioides]|uniref:Mos1 transposase HTH domain-containing protein n=1 Tax=Cordylochernes scorpioides TaxID=51811 RepID=A0ABY6KEG2_9ARAC|nr:hypothetical protein LAZ67_4002984 [Cordylochernes scorpioides]